MPICMHVLLSMFAASVASCAGAGTAGWRQVDASRPWITVRGRAEVVAVPPQGDCRIEVVPDSGCAFSTGPGQLRLPCIVHERDRQDMWPVLRRLRVGDTVEVSGYWAARDEAGGVRHYLNDVTAMHVVR